MGQHFGCSEPCDICDELLTKMLTVISEEVDGFFLNENFATNIQTTILTLLISNPSVTLAELSQLLGLPEDRITEELAKMQEAGLVNEDNEAIAEPEEEVFTVYKYKKRSDVSGPDVIDTTRDFCRSLVTQTKLGKSWTIQDIKLMNNGMGLDVFKTRGGWMTLEGTNTHVPFCRHIWEAHLVRKKV